MKRNNRNFWARLREDPSRWLWYKTKKRASRVGIHFNIEIEDVIVPKRCPALGIKLTFQNTREDWDSCATIDRIDNNKGYVKGNIVVVSCRANRIKTDATIRELQKVAEFYRVLKAA